ncbi:MAG TPA: hypothetical protein VMP67_10565 [Candidatus Limnocylindria bacterium]|nr:hypothetical protein [Candidatus Limnocylindria bacterium]
MGQPCQKREWRRQGTGAWQCRCAGTGFDVGIPPLRAALVRAALLVVLALLLVEVLLPALMSLAAAPYR